jgi:hypothetical protein
MQKRVTLVTTSHRKDIERFTLLCDSIDRFVTGYETHYVIVNDDDIQAFSGFNKPRRVVLPCSLLLPGWLKLLPPFLTRRGRRIWWSFGFGLIHGWHAQQLIKIGAVLQLPSQRFCLIDSDNVFFRRFDMAEYAGGDRAPLYCSPKAIEIKAPLHAVWARSCDRLLGHDATAFPADDYIGNLIVWDKLAVQGMTRAVERFAGKPWPAALCGTRTFSEYLLYGNFVRRSPQHLAAHYMTTDGPVDAYWEDSPLNLAALTDLVANTRPSKVALCIQSFSSTPVPLIREVTGL